MSSTVEYLIPSVLFLVLFTVFFRRLQRRSAPMRSNEFGVRDPLITRKLSGRASFMVYLLWTLLMCLGIVLSELLGSVIGDLFCILIASWMLYDHFVIEPKRRRRLLREVSEKEWLVCPGCLYRLKGLLDEGKRPECGRPYSHASLPRLWLAALGQQDSRGIQDNERRP